MAKSVGSGANGRARTLNTNTSRSSASSMNTRSNNNSVNGPRSTNSFQTVSGGSNVAFVPSQGKALGNSQVSGETSYQTAINQNAVARKSAGNAAISRQQRKSPSSSYKSAKSQRTMQRTLSATAAEARRGNIVPQNVLNSFKRNKNAMGIDLQRNIGREIEEGLMNKPITREKLSKLQKLLNNGKRMFVEKQRQEAAAKAKRVANAKAAASVKRVANAKAVASVKRTATAKAKRTPIKSMKKTSQSVKAVASSRQAGQRSAALLTARTTIPVMKELLKKQGVTNVNLGRSRAAYITALEKFGITPAPVGAPKKPRTPAPVGAPKSMRTAAQGASAYLIKKRELENKILGSLLITNKQKQNLTMNLQSGDVNQVRKKFNTLSQPRQNTYDNRSMCKSLLSIYKTKITNSEQLNDAEIIKQMMGFNIAFNKTKNSLSTDTSSDTKITLNQYFDILLIVWMDGVHDGYVDKYFINWYRQQIKENIFPSHRQSEIENMATNIANRNNSFIMSKVLEKLKGFAPQIIPGIISGVKLSVPEEVNAYTNETLTKLCGPYKEINTVTKVNRTKATNFVKKYYFAKNSPGLPDRPVNFNMKPGWEKEVKNFLLDHFKLTKKDKHTNQQIVLPDGKGILISIDQEYSTKQERPLTKLIDNEATTGLLTFGQALDPGSTMLPKLITSDLQGIVLTMRNTEPEPTLSQGNSKKSPNITNVNAKGFIPNAKYYLNDFSFTLTQEGTKVFDFKLDANNGDIPNLSLNNNKLIVNQSAGKASKATREASKISKFFGDALQYLIFTKIGKKEFESENGKVRKPFLTSGDSMMLLGYTVFSEIVGVKPFMLIDFSESNLPIYYPVNLPPKTKFPILKSLKNVSGRGNSRARSNA